MPTRSETIRLPDYSIEHQSWFIPLTQGVIALVDADMVPMLAQRNWYAMGDARQWRARSDFDGRRVLMHREITSAPADMQVDHRKHFPISAKVIDNRRANLRVCTRHENQRNARPHRNGASRYKGVCWNKRCAKWQASIMADGDLKHLGLFTDEAAAARAYDAAAVLHFGEFAHVNVGGN
jgi:hypothetical protein